MGRSRRKKTDLRSEIIYRLSLLAAIGGLFGGLRLFEALKLDSILTFTLSGASAIVAAFATTIVLSLLFRPKPKIEATFDFDEAPPSRQKAATEFEYEVAGLIHKMTGKRTEVVGGSGDGGVDIKVYEADGRLLGVVQCKNLASNKTVHPTYIRDLNTVRHYHQVKTAYLVSTGRFSEDSQKLAQQLGIKLIDGTALTRLRKKAV
jgi:HJR/Mrr/RecB family endonuclease